MRLRVLIALFMPATAALLVGIVVGTYVIAPFVHTGATAATARPTPAAVGAVPSGGAGAAASAQRTSIPGSSGAAGARPSLKPGSSGAPDAGATPVAALQAAPEGVVPILYYHRVEALPFGFSTWTKRSQDAFLVDDLLPFMLPAQLDWLAAHGYTTILPRDLVAHWQSGKPLPKRPVILTFDDGFRNWRTIVLPELQKRKMVAEFYVVLANVGRSISWDDVRTLATAGMGVGAHDVQHFQLAGGGVPTASEAVMRYQVSEAKRQIELNTGVTVDSMAYVGGGFNETLMRIVNEAGYTSARSIERGVEQSAAIRFRLHVSRISWKDDVTDIYNQRIAAGLPTFAKRISGVDPG